MFEKITITKARKLYADRNPFIMVACNLRPDGPMAIPVCYATHFDFNQMVDTFRY